MKVSQITGYSVLSGNNIQKKKTNAAPSFKSSLSEVERTLARKNIKTNFNGSLFVAECSEKVVWLFQKLYGKSCLPRAINFVSLKTIVHGKEMNDYGIYGFFDRTTDDITFNSNMHCFENMEALKKKSKSARGLVFNEYSSLHPACTFVHEFAHSAHKDNIRKQGRNPDYVMPILRTMQIPTPVGRLITRFKLGDYSLCDIKHGGLNEFMAERATHDICDALTPDRWLYWRPVETVNYSNIFQRKWNCRYTSPQSYLDYYTQQIWNGDIKMSMEAADRIRIYLEEIDRQTEAARLKQKSFWGVVDLVNAKIGYQAKWLDERNWLGYSVEFRVKKNDKN